MAGEFRAKGVHIALGPIVGPLGRIASSGRNWEGEKLAKFPIDISLTCVVGFSNDPYLCGALAFDTVTGIQSIGVQTSTKVRICSNLTRASMY